ncbi:MAG: AMP-binding protein [Gemmatimonadaceae bacterium]|nr:AMP-binding protein [Gemmatimonadaceae bacterium]
MIADLRQRGAAQAVFDGAGGRWLGADELLARAAECAARIRHRVDAPALIVLLCDNSIEALVGYLAAFTLEWPVAMVDAGMPADQRDRILTRYEPAVVIGSSAELDPAGVTHDGSTATPALYFAGRQTPPVAAGLALLLPTSGSTGSPKFVRLSRTAVEANARSIAAALGIGEGQRAITSLSMHYSYGLSVVNSHLIAGGELVLTGENLLSDAFWTLVRDQACTSMAGVPYSYQLLRRLDLDALNVPHLRTLTQAGGRLDPKLISHFHDLAVRRGGRLFVMYGQTEATARITILPAAALPSKLGSVGPAVPGGTLCIENEDGVVLDEPGHIGSIVYRGPNVMLGYASDAADLALGDEHGGRLVTGDLGYLDADGCLFITGRLKRISKVNGYRLNLDEVEAQIAPHGAVAVLGGDDRIVVFCEGWDAARREDVLVSTAKQFRLHRSSFVFRDIDRLPTLASGKVDYRALGELL